MKKILTILLFCFLLIGCSPTEQSKKEDNKVLSQNNSIQQKANLDDTESWRVFDKRTNEDFLKLYKLYNEILQSMQSDDTLSTYSFLKEAKNNLGRYSLSLDYGRNEEEKTYLQSLQSIAFAEQTLASEIMKYIDKGEMKYLNNAKESINTIKESINAFANNRGILLSEKANYTDEEIKKLISEYDLIDFGENNNQVDSEQNSFAIGSKHKTLVDDVNVRYGPGFSYSKLYKLKLGTEITILDKVEADGRTWCQIGENKWISIRTINGEL